tara:strand:- start:177 stop:389 length:213 start_codon:yes stop_codon:yes gene_type:complete
MAYPQNMMASRDAASYLGVTHNTLKTWRRTGEGPVFYRYSSRCIRYRRADLDAWIESQSASTVEAPTDAD